MLNRQSFLSQTEADLFIPYLVPKYAKAASVKYDAGGYWLNVHWKCGIIAPLTVQETEQALGDTQC